MPIQIFEAAKSRPLMIGLQDTSFEKLYLLRGSTDEVAIWNFLHASTPAAYLGMWKRNVAVDPQGGDFWNGKVQYGLPEGKEISGSNTPPEYTQEDLLGLEFEWDTTGGTQHITQSIRTISKTPRADLQGFQIPNFKRAIGVSEDGVAGCDVVVPKNEFTLTFRRERVSMRYYRTLEFVTGMMNSEYWNTFQPGEVIFLGSRGRYVGNNRDDFSFMISYRFATSENQTDLIVSQDVNESGEPIAGTEIKVPLKRGWDHIWCGYRKEEDVSQVIQRPMFAVVEEVCKSVNFKEVLEI